MRVLLLGEKMGEAAQIPPWPLRKRGQPLPFTHRTGIYGIAWEFMGVNGKTRDKLACARETSRSMTRFGFTLR
jgi:hypothetical protein